MILEGPIQLTVRIEDEATSGYRVRPASMQSDLDAERRSDVGRTLSHPDGRCHRRDNPENSIKLRGNLSCQDDA